LVALPGTLAKMRVCGRQSLARTHRVWPGIVERVLIRTL